MSFWPWRRVEWSGLLTVWRGKDEEQTREEYALVGGDALTMRIFHLPVNNWGELQHSKGDESFFGLDLSVHCHNMAKAEHPRAVDSRYTGCWKATNFWREQYA